MLGLTLSSCPVIGRSEEIAVDTAIEAQSSINDNYLFSRLPHPTVLVLALTPTLSLQDNTESTNLRIDGSATTYDVVRQPADNHTDLGLALSYNLHAETDSVGASATYSRTLTVESEFVTTGVLTGKQRRDDLIVGPNWTHNLSERMSMTLSLSDEQTRYSGAGEEGGASNYHYYYATGVLTYLASERDSVSVSLVPSKYLADHVDEQTLAAQASVDWQHQFTEHTNAEISVGEFYTRVTSSTPLEICPLPVEYCQLGIVPFVRLVQNEDHSVHGSLANLGLNAGLSESTTLSAHASRTLSPSGLGGLLLTEAFDIGLDHDFDETRKGSLKYSQVRSLFPGGSSTGYLAAQQTISGIFEWKLSPVSSLQAGVNRTNSILNQAGVPNVHGDAVFMNYRYAWPHSAQARLQ